MTENTIIYFNDNLKSLCDELDELCTEYRHNAVLELQSKVQLWAIRYSSLPRVCRPLCLHYFKKWASRYNDVVRFLYPPVEGAPLPVEELNNDVI